VVTAAHALGVEMPISEAVNRIIHTGANLDEVVAELLARPFKPEDVIPQGPKR